MSSQVGWCPLRCCRPGMHAARPRPRQTPPFFLLRTPSTRCSSSGGACSGSSPEKAARRQQRPGMLSAAPLATRSTVPASAASPPALPHERSVVRYGRRSGSRPRGWTFRDAQQSATAACPPLRAHLPSSAVQAPGQAHHARHRSFSRRRQPARHSRAAGRARDAHWPEAGARRRRRQAGWWASRQLRLATAAFCQARPARAAGELPAGGGSPTGPAQHQTAAAGRGRTPPPGGSGPAARRPARSGARK